MIGQKSGRGGTVCGDHGAGGAPSGTVTVRVARSHRPQGFWWRPSWRSLREGQRPPEPEVGEPGEWRHGWQCWSSPVSDFHFGKERRLCSTVGQLLVRLTCAGFNAGVALAHCPTAPEYTMPPHLFRTFLLERLQLPLQVTEARCEGCHALLDTLGHRASCTGSGRVKKRATPIERVVGRIFREASASVRQNVFLKDMNVQVASSRPGPSLLWRGSVGDRCHSSRGPNRTRGSPATCSRPGRNQARREKEN